MFSNIGGKIKKLAKVLCWIGIIISVISGIAIIASGGRSGGSYVYGGSSVSINGGAAVIAGILFIVLGSLLSWVGSFVLYGFGQLVENSDKLAERADHPMEQ